MSLLSWAKRKVAEHEVHDLAEKVDTPEKAKAVVDEVLSGGGMSDGWKAWLHSLVAALLGGIAGSIAQGLADPSVLSEPSGLKRLAAGAIAGGLVAVAGLLKQSPLPPPSK